VCVICNRAYHHAYDAAAIEAERGNAQQARKILGYSNLRFFDLPDERLESHFVELLSRLEEVVSEIRPEVVYTCYAGDLHQDHRTVAHASNIALRALSAPWVRRVLAYEIPSGTDQMFPQTALAFQPSVFVDIENHVDRKCAALAAYERESRSLPHPRSSEILKAWALVRGAQCGRRAAEAFVLLRESV
jgi:LmbE family N-acetylglucosaminyl deacetylase